MKRQLKVRNLRRKELLARRTLEEKTNHRCANGRVSHHEKSTAHLTPITFRPQSRSSSLETRWCLITLICSRVKMFQESKNQLFYLGLKVVSEGGREEEHRDCANACLFYICQIRKGSD